MQKDETNSKEETSRAGLYIVLYSPPPVGGGKIIKGFREREGKGRRKKEKKEKNWGKYNFWQ